MDATLLLRQARLTDHDELVDIAIAGNRIEAIAPNLSLTAPTPS